MRKKTGRITVGCRMDSKNREARKEKRTSAKKGTALPKWAPG